MKFTLVSFRIVGLSFVGTETKGHIFFLMNGASCLHKGGAVAPVMGSNIPTTAPPQRYQTTSLMLLLWGARSVGKSVDSRVPYFLRRYYAPFLIYPGHIVWSY